MPYLDAKDGTKLFYKDWGSGPPVVLIHGWPLNADMWEYQAGPIASRGYRVIAYDRRGFGRSEQPWGGYDYDTLAADLDAVVETLGLQGATLVGFSMGGGEVARYLASYGSARIAKAALVSSVVPYVLQAEDNPDGVEESVFKDMIEGLEDDRPSFLADFGKKFYGVGLLSMSMSSELLEWSRGLALQASPKATIDCVRAFSETDFRPDCAKIDVPTLIVLGSGDNIVPPDAAGRAAAKMMKGAELIEYHGAPHGLFYTEKERLNKDVLAFLGR